MSRSLTIGELTISTIIVGVPRIEVHLCSAIELSAASALNPGVG